MNSNGVVALLVALMFISAMLPRLKMYTVEESVFFLLVVAAVELVLLFFLVAFALLREVVRFGFPWLRANFRHLVGLRQRQLAPAEPLGHPPPHR